ncbi:MAG: hypothetical protein ABFD92_02100 [Planctomycetaceae bacterium]|nr:hypothetical protein [Planctomycetaceae bacterium]
MNFGELTPEERDEINEAIFGHAYVALREILRPLDEHEFEVLNTNCPCTPFGGRPVKRVVSHTIESKPLSNIRQQDHDQIRHVSNLEKSIVIRQEKNDGTESL